MNTDKDLFPFNINDIGKIEPPTKPQQPSNSLLQSINKDANKDLFPNFPITNPSQPLKVIGDKTVSENPEITGTQFQLRKPQ